MGLMTDMTEKEMVDNLATVLTDKEMLDFQQILDGGSRFYDELTKYVAERNPDLFKPAITTCGVCGKTGDMDDPDVLEKWHPYAYRDDIFRGDEEVSPVCTDHPGHYDDKDSCYIVD